MNRWLLAAALVTATTVSFGGCERDGASASSGIGSTQSGIVHRPSCLTLIDTTVVSIDATGSSGGSYSSLYPMPSKPYGLAYCEDYVVDFVLPSTIPATGFNIYYLGEYSMQPQDCESTTLSATIYGLSDSGWETVDTQITPGALKPVPGQPSCTLNQIQQFHFDVGFPYSKLRFVATIPVPSQGNPPISGWTNWPIEVGASP